MTELLCRLDLGAEAGWVRASAELNALYRISVQPGEGVVRFVADTADGRCCAEAVKEVLNVHFGATKVTVERVGGLQVRDPQLLRSAGLINLTRRLIHFLDIRTVVGGGGCVLNTNGGFKGLVPFFAMADSTSGHQV
jgi:putative CRISPR-associated protein (TIGR02619 family)